MFEQVGQFFYWLWDGVKGIEIDMQAAGIAFVGWLVCMGVLWKMVVMGDYSFFEKMLLTILSLPVIYIVTYKMINR